MKRKCISLLLAIVLVFSSLQIIVAEEPSNDVKYEVDPMEQISEEYTDFDPEYPDEYPRTEEASHTDRHSDGIYELVISPSQAYLLVGDTLQLIAEFLTEPPAEEETHFDGAEESEDQTAAQNDVEDVSEESESELVDDAPIEETTAPLADDTFVPETQTEPETQAEAEFERNEETETTAESAAEIPMEESTIFTTTELEEGCEREVVTEAATDILEEESTTLAEAEPEAVSASRLPADPDELMWNSSNEEVAVIGAGGVVTAMSLGSTVITAYTADERFSAVCEISVVEELPVEEEPSDPRLIFGRVVILPSNDLSDIPTHYAVKIASTADVDFDVYKCDSNGNHTGNEVSDQIKWTSSDTSIATVDSSGHVRGISNGSVTISVKARVGIITVHNPIHVTVYTAYTTPHDGLAKAWVNQYRSTVTDCHDDRFVRKISPATKLSIYGTSGGFSYASVSGQNDKQFMWTQNIYDQTTGGSITICRSSDSDERRHWDMYTTQTLQLKLTNGASCTWSTSNASVAKINNAASYTGAVATINPVAEGTAYITAQQGSKIDVIHVTTITQLASSWGITVSWCGKYKCSHLDCTIIDRKEGDTEPGKLVTIYGQSGGFYYANVQGESTYRYMWKNNISLYDWYRLREMDNHSESTFFTTGRAPQGLAIDENYCYSFEVPVEKKDNQGNILVQGQDTDGLHHRLYRYCYTTGERIQMTRTTNPNDSTKDVGALYHANDACIVSFNEGNTVVSYIFVMAYRKNAENYIVKLGFNNTTCEYWEEARYPTNDEKFAGISLLSGGGSESAVFLLQQGSKFYKAQIASNKDDQSDVWATTPSHAFIIERTVEDVDLEQQQSIHYEASNHRLYVAYHLLDIIDAQPEPYQWVYRNHVNEYQNVDDTTSNVVSLSDTQCLNFKQSNYFEIEGIGFAPNQSYNRLFFSTFEGRKNAGIYRANNILR